MSTTRRTFLRTAAGAVLGLPCLESVALAATVPAKRYAIFYVPIGVLRDTFFPGESNRQRLTKHDKPDGREFKQFATGNHPLELTPTLQPLRGHENHITLVTGLDRAYQAGADPHAQCGSCFLSSAAPYGIENSLLPVDRTLDHVIADSIGGTTPFRTLEFSCNSHKDNKESIFFNNISWYGTGHVAPSLADPRKAYQRLFRTSNSDFSRITDVLLDDANDLKRGLSSHDQQKFGEYFEAIRTIERQVKRLGDMHDELATYAMPEPPESHIPRGEYIRLMSDMMIVALQSGLTNVSTFMVGPERWGTPFTYETVFDSPRSHHQMSHDPVRCGEDLAKLDRFHVEQFAYVLERMAAIKEANGSSLLDNTIITYGSGLSDGARHDCKDLPIVVAGGASHGLKHNRHYHAGDSVPLANLWLSHCRLMGVTRDRFADSTGPISELTG